MPADRRGAHERRGFAMERREVPSMMRPTNHRAGHSGDTARITGDRGGVDLHTHTTASDGVMSPRELIEAATEVGLEAIAVTDHDTTAGIAPALQAARDIIVVPGIEISCDVEFGTCHMLGYFIDPDSPFLLEPLRFLRRRRRERAAEILERLAGLGMRVEVADRPEQSSVGRPHIAGALVAAGFVGSYEEAFHRFLGDGKPAFVPGPKLLPVEAIEMITRAGGVSALAHPHTFDDEAMIRVYARAGLRGIEAYYGWYDEAQSSRWKKIADDAGLIATGGSDFHGHVRPNRKLGVVRLNVSILDVLRNRR